MNLDTYDDYLRRWRAAFGENNRGEVDGANGKRLTVWRLNREAFDADVRAYNQLSEQWRELEAMEYAARETNDKALEARVDHMMAAHLEAVFPYEVRLLY